MPRIRWLQTSDVHLRADRPERRRALELAFGAAEAHAADGILIAGDLFDRAHDAASERAAVRELIEAFAPRPVVLVPGNHDAEAYGDETDFGANGVVLSRTPYTRALVNGVDLVGLPYQHGRTAAECLTGLACEPRQTILVGHATVMDGGGAFAGEGEDGAYMPIAVGDVLKRFSYAALGHLHSGRNLIRRDGERLVAYAGSPAAHSRREVGPRGVLLVDFESGVGVLGHEFLALPMPYYERVEVSCVPGGEEEAIAQLAREASALRKPNLQVLARLSGVSTESEAALREAATTALARAWKRPAGAGAPAGTAEIPEPVIELHVASYAALAQTPVVGEFVSRLVASGKAGDDPRLLETALRLGLGAFLESLP
ncbi:MAG TPA: metallophosphoesterase [Candidatus Binatia bacterium]|nr:metallophosphoesterase [Candidatus Binatia bacterium]